MRFLPSNSGASTSVLLTPHEQTCLINALSEICHTFELPDFVATVGATRETTEQLLDRIYKARGGDHSVQVRLTKTELRIIRSALSETLGRVDEREFHARVGTSRQECENILRAIDQRGNH
jgi:hypothetical protein